jgi:hypothetical protein
VGFAWDFENMVYRAVLLFCFVLLSPQLNALNCPERFFSKEEIAAKLSDLRKEHKQLPQPFSQQEDKLTRMNCLYVYYEYEMPKSSGKSHEFTFDSYGELMRYYVND